MHWVHQKCTNLARRQGNKPEKEYQELLPGTPVWIQHRQNATWEPTVVVNQTDAQKAQMKELMPEKENVEFQTPAIPYRPGNSTVENSQDQSSSSGLA